MKSYTDLEQSKELAKILPLESADMCYNDGELRIEYASLAIKRDDYFPCWSLAALMNLLPSEFTKAGKFSTTTYKIDVRKYKFTDDVDLYQIAYGSIKIDVDGQFSFKDMINTGERQNLIDCCYEMIIKLKEMNLL